MKYNFCFFIVLLFLITGNKVSAQTSPYPVLAMEVENIPAGNVIAPSGDIINPDSILYNATMHIELYDTVNIDLIQIKLGSTPGSGNLLQKNFEFDVPGTLSDGTTYHRTGSVISLGLGSYTGLSQFYSELIIKRADGSFTSSLTFSR